MTAKTLGAERESTAAQVAYAAHAEGARTTASAAYAHAEGYNNTASAQTAHVEGQQNTASGYYSHAGGVNANADAHASFSRGGAGGGLGSSRAQVSIYELGIVTTNSAQSYFLTFDGSGSLVFTGAGTNTLFVPQFSNYQFELNLTARRAASSTTSQGWLYAGLIARDSGNCRMVGSVTQLATWSDTSLGSVSITANTTWNILSIQVTPSSSSSTTWHGVLTVNELALTS